MRDSLTHPPRAVSQKLTGLLACACVRTRRMAASLQAKRSLVTQLRQDLCPAYFHVTAPPQKIQGSPTAGVQQAWGSRCACVCVPVCLSLCVRSSSKDAGSPAAGVQQAWGLRCACVYVCSCVPVCVSVCVRSSSKDAGEPHSRAGSQGVPA